MLRTTPNAKLVTIVAKTARKRENLPLRNRSRLFKMKNIGGGSHKLPPVIFRRGDANSFGSIYTALPRHDFDGANGDLHLK